MTTFLIAAALMLAAALSFILPALLRQPSDGAQGMQRSELNLQVLRDQLRELDADRASGAVDETGYDNTRKELERRVAEDVKPVMRIVKDAARKPWLAILLGMLLPVSAVGLYLLLGNPSGLEPARLARNDPAQTVTPEQIGGMVEKLAKRLQDKPGDIEGWNMLARSYSVLGRFGEAAQAYAHLLKLTPPNAELLADYADSLGMSRNRSLQGEPEKIIEQALKLDPKNVKALALSGGAFFERHDYAQAIGQWKKILALTPPDSEIARSVLNSIDQAQSLAGTSGGKAASAPQTNAAPSSPAVASISGTVELDPGLRSQASDTDSVFIYARAVEGPRFPLAVLRKQVKDLPVSFTLDDSMSMIPNAKLSNFPLVVVGARISKSGNATASIGDLEGASEPVQPGAAKLKITIKSQRR